MCAVKAKQPCHSETRVGGEEKRFGRGSISSNLKLKLAETGHLPGNRNSGQQSEKDSSQDMTFFQRVLLINTWNIYELLCTLLHVEILLYSPCHVFLNCLSVSTTPTVVPLPPSLPMLFSGIMACLQPMYAIPVSPVSSHRSYCTNTPLLQPRCFARVSQGHRKRLLNSHSMLSNQMQDHQLLAINKFYLLTGSSVALDSEDK